MTTKLSDMTQDEAFDKLTDAGFVQSAEHGDEYAEAAYRVESSYYDTTQEDIDTLITAGYMTGDDHATAAWFAEYRLN